MNMQYEELNLYLTLHLYEILVNWFYFPRATQFGSNHVLVGSDRQRIPLYGPGGWLDRSVGYR